MRSIEYYKPSLKVRIFAYGMTRFSCARPTERKKALRNNTSAYQPQTHMSSSRERSHDIPRQRNKAPPESRIQKKRDG